MKHWKLFYNKPADQWTEALPLGNGELGAMVSGSIVDETISLNLDTLWSGNGSDKENPGKIHDWNSIRKDVFQGQYQSAEQKIKEQILGNWTECYLPAGTLHLHFMHESDEYCRYRRELNLNNAVYCNEYQIQDTQFHREILFLQFTFKNPGHKIFHFRLDLTVFFNMKLFLWRVKMNWELQEKHLLMLLLSTMNVKHLLYTKQAKG